MKIAKRLNKFNIGLALVIFTSHQKNIVCAHTYFPWKVSEFILFLPTSA